MSQKRILKKKKLITEDTLIVGVDISGTSKHSGYWFTRSGYECKVFFFDNDINGFNYLLEQIMYAKKSLSMKKIILGFESTGSYGDSLLYFLKTNGVKLVQINPMNTKKAKELDDNTPLKSDIKDPKVIADLVADGHYLSVNLPTDNSAKLRRLTKTRESHIKDRTSKYNRLQQLIQTLFPEIKKVIKNSKSKTLKYLMMKYTTPERIGKLGKSRLCKILKKESRGNYGMKQAEELIEYARCSVGVKEGSEELVTEIRQIFMLIEMIDKFIDEIEMKMEKVLKRIPYSANLLSNKGIGLITVSGIIGEVLDFIRFRNQRAILKYAGLNLYEKSSGKHHGIRRITKRGRGLLRKLLYFTSINTVKKGGIMHDYYKRLVETNGMIKKKALVAVSKKILCLMYAQVRDNTYYNEEHHEKKILRKAA